jgi:hypothetical protein
MNNDGFFATIISRKIRWDVEDATQVDFGSFLVRVVARGGWYSLWLRFVFKDLERVEKDWVNSSLIKF